ncbi:MAG TPA: hypothetical protein VKV73_03905 [Chloroflexota bacterium]|nr:hypothetical protein [Chloroflexota bacterium]
MMRSTRFASASTSAVLLPLGLASLLPFQSPPAAASAASTVHVAQAMDPTLQALATEAALAVTRAALIPTPNPTSLAQAIDQAGAITIHGVQQLQDLVMQPGDCGLGVPTAP